MEKHEEQLAAIQEMRNLMDRASRFRSISGLSAMVAGLLAILCVVFVSQLTDVQLVESEAFERMLRTKVATGVQLSFLVLLLISICFGIYLHKVPFMRGWIIGRWEQNHLKPWF